MTHGCKSIQYVLSFMDVDIQSVVRNILYKEVNDSKSNNSIITKLSQNISELINQIVTTTSKSNFVYNPLTKNFQNITIRKLIDDHHYDKLSNQLYIELHIDKEEFRNLSDII